MTTPLSPVSSTTPPTATQANAGFGPAQPAVDTVLRLQAEYAVAVRDPATHSAGSFDVFLAGQAKQAFDESFAAAKRAGVEYRGTPPAARVRVVADKTSARTPQVVLINCPQQLDADPFRAFDVKTNKPVPVPTSAVAPPYAQTAKVFKVNERWVITQFSTDASKTCSA